MQGLRIKKILNTTGVSLSCLEAGQHTNVDRFYRPFNRLCTIKCTPTLIGNMLGAGDNRESRRGSFVFPYAIRDRFSLKADLEEIDHEVISLFTEPAHIGPLMDDLALLELEMHIGARVRRNRRRERVDRSHIKGFDPLVAHELNGLMSLTVRLMGDLNLQDIVQPRRSDA